MIVILFVSTAFVLQSTSCTEDCGLVIGIAENGYDFFFMPWTIKGDRWRHYVLGCPFVYCISGYFRVEIFSRFHYASTFLRDVKFAVGKIWD